jgi:hypothetical protein
MARFNLNGFLDNSRFEDFSPGSAAAAPAMII